MRLVRVCLILPFLLFPVMAQEPETGPSNEKAKKSFKEGLAYLNQHKQQWALDSFKKADKQDGRHCATCQKQMVRYGMESGDWKPPNWAPKN
jgi:Tfp pilus assembly protein PilF